MPPTIRRSGKAGKRSPANTGCLRKSSGICARPGFSSKLAHHSNEVFRAPAIVRTRGMGGDVRKDNVKRLFQIDQFPAHALAGRSTDLPAAQYVVAFRADADAMHFDDARP